MLIQGATATFVRYFSRKRSPNLRKINPKVQPQEASVIAKDLYQIIKSNGPLTVPKTWDHVKVSDFSTNQLFLCIFNLYLVHYVYDVSNWSVKTVSFEISREWVDLNCRDPASGMKYYRIRRYPDAVLCEISVWLLSPKCSYLGNFCWVICFSMEMFGRCKWEGGNKWTVSLWCVSLVGLYDCLVLEVIGILSSVFVLKGWRSRGEDDPQSAIKYSLPFGRKWLPRYHPRKVNHRKVTATSLCCVLHTWPP